MGALKTTRSPARRTIRLSRKTDDSSVENTRNEIHPFERVTEAWKWSFVLIFGRASPGTEEGAEQS